MVKLCSKTTYRLLVRHALSRRGKRSWEMKETLGVGIPPPEALVESQPRTTTAAWRTDNQVRKPLPVSEGRPMLEGGDGLAANGTKPSPSVTIHLFSYGGVYPGSSSHECRDSSKRKPSLNWGWTRRHRWRQGNPSRGRKKPRPRCSRVAGQSVSPPAERLLADVLNDRDSTHAGGRCGYEREKYMANRR